MDQRFLTSASMLDTVALDITKGIQRC